MEDNNNNNNNNEDEQLADDSDKHSQNKDKFDKCETIEEGTFAFMHWPNSDKRGLYLVLITNSFIEIYQ